MLYTESMERVSPLVIKEIEHERPVTQTWWTGFADRYRSPRLDLGLSLGSASFLVAMPGRAHRIPARIAINTSTGKVVAAGRLAADMEGRESEQVSVKRPVVDGVIVDQNLAGQLLKSTLSSSRHGLLTAPRVAVAVPGDLSAVESQTLSATLEFAGIRSIYMVDQALAAAAGAGRDLLRPDGHLVIHMSAGVTQVSLCSLAHCLLSRTLRTAGDAMLAALQDLVRREHSLIIGRSVAKNLLDTLGSALPPQTERELTVAGQAVNIGKPAQKSITSIEVYRALEPILDEIADMVCKAVRELPIGLLPDVERSTILLSGSGATLSDLDRFLHLRTRLKVTVPDEPELLVEKGLQKILTTAKLRRALFLKNPSTTYTPGLEERRGTALVGMLMLTATLALASSSAAWLPQGAAAMIEGTVHPLVTPVAPANHGWGWVPPLKTEDDQENSPESLMTNELQAENERLRTLLKAPARKYGQNAVTADVLARDPRGWMSAITINVGSRQGVKPGMIVTDGQALVGQVHRVQEERSQVRLFTDTKSVVAGKLQSGKGAGVIVGHGKQRVEMRYLDPDCGIKIGDPVLTSGHDESFPPGLLVGTVSAVHRPSENSSLSASVEIATDLTNLSQVVVFQP